MSYDLVVTGIAIAVFAGLIIYAVKGGKKSSTKGGSVAQPPKETDQQ